MRPGSVGGLFVTVRSVCPFIHLNVDEDDDPGVPASFNPFVYPRTQKG